MSERLASRSRAAPVLERSADTRTGMTGAVLCGGRSCRMGRDKALLELDGAPLIVRAAGILGTACDEVLLATGTRARYPELGLAQVLDAVPDGGPLAGLEAALSGSRGDWVALLACDVPFVPGAHFAALRAAAERGGLDACLTLTPAGREPLCAVYHRRCAAFVRASLARGERRMVEFWERAGELRVGFLECESGDPGRNLNTPADLGLARALVGRAQVDPAARPRGEAPHGGSR